MCLGVLRCIVYTIFILSKTFLEKVYLVDWIEIFTAYELLKMIIPSHYLVICDSLFQKDNAFLNYNLDYVYCVWYWFGYLSIGEVQKTN